MPMLLCATNSGASGVRVRHQRLVDLSSHLIDLDECIERFDLIDST